MASLRSKVPRFASAVGKMIRRGPFLDGTQKTYFAPGQWPDCFSDSQTGYRAPTGFPSAGTLLRAPQMVCISFNCTIQSIASPVLYGAWDYIGIAEQVKNAVQGMRPGVTFVDIMDYNFQWQALGGQSFATGHAGFNHPNPNNSPDSDLSVRVSLGHRYNFMMFPSQGDVFFGTDFLHLYFTGWNAAIDPVIWFSYPDTPSTPNYNVVIDTTYPRTFWYDQGLAGNVVIGDSRDTIYADSRKYVVASYPKFAGHKTYMYGVDTVGPFYDGTFGLNTLDIVTGTIQNICTDLAPYGFVYGGGIRASGTVTYDSMLAQIASHYNFDPETGKDLPVT